jgi:hypothetical protein
MKFSILVLPIFLLAACASKQAENTKTDNQKLERYFETLFNIKVTATVYIVHPEVCGACSNEFLVEMSEKDPGSKFFLLATGTFKEEHRNAAYKIRHKIKFVNNEKLGRIGLSVQVPQKVVLINGKVERIDYLDL